MDICTDEQSPGLGGDIHHFQQSATQSQDATKDLPKSASLQKCLKAIMLGVLMMLWQTMMN